MFVPKQIQIGRQVTPLGMNSNPEGNAMMPDQNRWQVNPPPVIPSQTNGR